MFHTDSMYVKGHTHKVCQDYADHNEMGAAISDGCSGSKDTDIGARLIVRSLLYGNDTLWDELYPFYGKGQFSKEMFDATLLNIGYESKRDVFCVDVIGDGGCAYQSINGNWWFIEYVYPAGYPNYISYRIDMKRDDLRSYEQRELICNVYRNGEIVDSDKDGGRSYYYPSVTSSIAVFSDGIESFTDKEGSKIEAVKIVKELMAFKNTQGEFVTRRMSRFLRDCEKRGWSHYDDLSMAAIVVDR